MVFDEKRLQFRFLSANIQWDRGYWRLCIKRALTACVGLKTADAILVSDIVVPRRRFMGTINEERRSLGAGIAAAHASGAVPVAQYSRTAAGRRSKSAWPRIAPGFYWSFV